MNPLYRPVLGTTCPHCSDAKARLVTWKVAAVLFALGFTVALIVVLG